MLGTRHVRVLSRADSKPLAAFGMWLCPLLPSLGFRELSTIFNLHH